MATPEDLYTKQKHERNYTMSINETLRAALAAAEAAAAQEASKVHDSPEPQVQQDATEQVAEQVADEDVSTWKHVADVAAQYVPAAGIKLKGLDEKAVLVELHRSKFGTSRQDKEETEKYGGGNVTKHLFKDKTCRMAVVNAAYYEVYRYVNDETVPWAKGVRMLNIDSYMDFTTGLRQRVDAANAAVSDLIAHWDYEVQKDLDRLTDIEINNGKAPGSLADPSNYPHASEMPAKFGIDTRFMPVPTVGDFRVQISDADKASLQRQLEEVEANAAKHVLEQMLEPMQRAVEKLSVPVGQDGSVFRDSLIDNMVEVADRMERVNVSADEAVTAKITELRTLVGAYANNKDVLRNNQHVRNKAATQINDLVGSMAGLV